MTPGTTPSEFDARRHRGQLPAEVTGFVGRASELSWLATLLDSARLITVVGPGGVGKTRVALRAAARAADEFPDGVRLVELSGLRDPALLPNAVASCLGLVEQDDRPQLAAVLDHLRTRRLLLILDTCEHLVDACALLAEAILRQTAAVTVLATSRQPLDVPGEHTFRLQPLPVPEPEEEASAFAAGSGDAVELFAQRALAAVPGFVVTAANRADVIRLCRRLDGIPLAIELAAVRLRALPLPELTDRLENRFRVLTGGRRGTVSRHQTLRTAIEWSYSLCTPAERALWDRLSVFAGNFDVAAAEDVGACDMVPRDRVLQVLVSLVDKSVVLRDGPDGPAPRYRLLDSLREFAAERLAESGQEADCRARHIARYLAMARDFGRNFADDDQLARLRQLRAEHDNIRAALEYAFAGPGSDRDAAGLACVLYSYWHISGSLREGAYWLDKVLDTFPGPAPSPPRASALIDRALIGSVQGHPEAVARAREGTEMAALLGDERLSARGYLALNLALTFAGYHDEAVDAGRQARRRLAAADSRVGLICLDAQMGLLYQLSGKFDQSVESCQHGLRGLAAGERWLRSYLHVVSAFALYQQPGQEAECAEALRQGLAAKHELGDYVGGAFALEALAWLAADAGRCERAGWLLGAAHPLWERAGTRLGNNAIMEEFHQRAAAKAGEALGAARFDALYAAGAVQPLDRIIALAIGDADSLTAGSGGGGRDREAGGLTKREQQIASLVASGLSNREIAEKLVISKRTVDAHVDHIFAKLGISSRVQLTVWLREQLPWARSGELTRF